MADEFIGPPQENPFEKMTPEQHAAMERDLAVADGIKNYLQAPMFFGAWGPSYAKLQARGGLTREEATNLSRYRMWKMGMPNVPLGPREPDQTDDDKRERSALLFSYPPGSPGRAGVWAHDQAARDRAHQNFFDQLIFKPAEPLQNKMPEQSQAEDLPNPRKEKLASAK